MHLYIRADADGKIGTGHVMRCIALAQAWQDHEGKVTFISRCESDVLRERIIQEGFQFISVENPHPHPSDLEDTLNLLSKICNPQSAIRNWLVLDGYNFTPEYQKAIRDEGRRLLVIDDMNHLPYYHADILLNQNINAPGLHYHCDEDATLLLGTRYVLLRREFLKYRDFNRQIPDRAKKILVTLGGADPDNVTTKVIEALKLLNEPNIAVRIIIGPANPHQEMLRKALATAHFEAELLINPPNMPELMAWADMAISAGGSTCWELAFMGVPNIVITLADNQKSVADGIAKTGMALNIGWHNIVEPRLIAQTIDKILLSGDRRADMAQKGRAAIDGEGANRLIKQINAASISIRKVTESDCELIWHWANDSTVRSSAFCLDFIPLEKHEKWFYSKLQNPECFLFIGCNDNNQPIGQIRFDTVRTGEVEVDVSIDKDCSGKGYGVQLIKKGIDELLKISDVKTVHSYIKQNNNVSKSVFINAGFLFDGIEFIHDTEAHHYIWKKKEIIHSLRESSL